MLALSAVIAKGWPHGRLLVSLLMLMPSDPLGGAGVTPRGEQEPQIALILELAQRGTTPG